MSPARTIHPRIQLATLKAAAWLLSITLGLTAQAATNRPEAIECEHRPPIGQSLGRLHKDLALDATQDAQWKSAIAATETLRHEMRDAHRSTHEQLKAELKAPAPDLRAVAARLDKQREEQLKKRQQARETWLAFYDGLKPEQKEKASHFLLHQITLLGEFAPGMMQARQSDRRRKPAEASGTPLH